MQLPEVLGNRNVKEVIKVHPAIGEILDRHGIGCGKCSIGTCILREVVAVHFLDAGTEKLITDELSAYLAGP